MADNWLYASGNMIEYAKLSEEIKITGKPLIQDKSHTYKGTDDSCIKLGLMHKNVVECERNAYIHPPIAPDMGDKSSEIRQ